MKNPIIVNLPKSNFLNIFAIKEPINNPSDIAAKKYA